MKSEKPCGQCGNYFLPYHHDQDYCSKKCANASRYTSANIKVLPDDEIVNNKKFLWAKASALAEQYIKPSDWIYRSLLACTLAEVPHQYFIDKYLLNISDIPLNDNVSEYSKLIQCGVVES